MPVRQYELELDDDNFKTFAFKTHPLAYLDAGLADLGISDLSKIGMQPNIQEWGDLRTLKQAGVSGWPVGMVLSGLAIVLAAVSSPGGRRPVIS